MNKQKPVHHKSTTHRRRYFLLQIGKHLLFFISGATLGIITLAVVITIVLSQYEQQYKDRVYAGVTIEGVPVGGYTKEEITNYWLQENERFAPLTFTLEYDTYRATVSAQQLNIGYDATTSATQAYSVGRSGNALADWYQKLVAWKNGLDLPVIFQYKTGFIESTLEDLSERIDIPTENALFEFENNRVSAFKPAKNGRRLDVEKAKKMFEEKIQKISHTPTDNAATISLSLPVVTLLPDITNNQANSYGIVELIGSGESFFKGSIPGRVHNVALAASRINGVLIKPNETFSFNDAVGDISAATGYKQAYVIKEGRTVLDDGGGVCQVSTTLFRAALNAGLPIIERHAHSYRVGYYEQGGWKPGYDATVFAPSYDLKMKNDTGHYILIQAKTDTAATHLVFELYGTKDGREVKLSPTRLWDPKPAPPDLYQDDPTLPSGTIKQVDWANAGINAAFDYTVTKSGETVFQKTFNSYFVPWQAVFLKGTKT